MTDTKPHHRGRFIWREALTHDLAKTKAFYSGLFGWTLETMKMGPEGEYTIIKQGDKGIGGMMALGKDKTHVPAHWESYVSVADVDACFAIAKKNGGTVTWGPIDVPNTGRMGGVMSFDHAALSMMTPAGPDQPSSGRPPVGTFCWETLTTSDVERSKKFWSEVCGWKASSGAGMPTFAVGEGMENQVADIQQAQGPVPPHWLTFVVVANVEPAAARAVELGGKQMMPVVTVPNIGRIGVITDDQGAAIGLFEPGM